MYTSGRSSARRASTVVRGTTVTGVVGGQDNNNIGQDASSSISNVVFVAPTVVSNANRFVRTTSSSLVRATSVPTTPGPSTSNSSSHWNNSGEQETDYVVDPVQGKAYYKGQFLGRVSNFLYLSMYYLSLDHLVCALTHSIFKQHLLLPRFFFPSFFFFLFFFFLFFFFLFLRDILSPLPPRSH